MIVIDASGINNRTTIQQGARIMDANNYHNSIWGCQTRETTAPKPKRRRIVRDWQCNECKRLMTFEQAERAVYSLDGCPGCGGTDVEPA